jgi:hypothetical protein
VPLAHVQLADEPKNALKQPHSQDPVQRRMVPKCHFRRTSSGVRSRVLFVRTSRGTTSYGAAAGSIAVPEPRPGLVECARELIGSIAIGIAALIVSTDLGALLLVTFIDWFGSR